MKYYVILEGQSVLYVCPDGHSPTPGQTTERYMRDYAAWLQSEMDTQDGITSAWKRKRIVRLQCSEGFELPKVIESATQVYEHELHDVDSANNNT